MIDVIEHLQHRQRQRIRSDVRRKSVFYLRSLPVQAKRDRYPDVKKQQTIPLLFMLNPAHSFTSHPPFKVGNWLVEPRVLQIKRNEESRKMTKKMMEVLVCLANHQGVVLSKQEIMDTVWAGVFVSEGTVRRTISQLRQLLDDIASTPLYIETIPGVGYRLIAPVENIAPVQNIAPVESRASSDALAQFPPFNKRYAPAQIAFFRSIWPWLLILLATLIFWLINSGNNPAPAQSQVVQPMQSLQITSFLGDELAPVLSPDAQRVIFTRIPQTSGRPQPDLYIKMVDSEPHLQLTNDNAFEATAAWSPDGLHIAYTALREIENISSCDIYRVSAIGGAPRKLTGCTLMADGHAPTLTWSPDGKSIVYAQFDASRQSTALQQLALDTNTLSSITQPDAQSHDLEPRFSPSGNQLAFIRQFNERSAIFIMETPQSAPREIYAMDGELWSLHWKDDGNTLYVVAGEPNQEPALWAISVSGAVRRQLRLPAHASVGMQIDIRNNRLAYTHLDTEADLWHLDLNAGAQTRTRLDLSSSQHDLSPAFDPTGNQIAFISNRSNRVSLWIGTPADNNIHELTPMQGSEFTRLIWDAAGRNIYYGSNTGLFSVDVTTGQITQWTTSAVRSLFKDGDGPLFFETGASLPPEDTTAIGTGPIRIMRMPAAGPTDIVATLKSEEQLRSVHNGDLFITSIRDESLTRLQLHNNRIANRIPVELDFQIHKTAPTPWIFTQNGFYYIGMTPLPTLHFFDFNAGTSTPVHQFSRGMVRNLSIFQDRMVYDLEELRGIDIMLLEDFDQGI